ncbi:hypothetical protein Tco_0328243 [Tanacetum coccineum]
MTSKAQQIELDNALVSPKNCHVIGKCNMRINLGMKPKEPTYQVVLDALALTTCYLAFLITAEVLVIYMHQDIINICPRIPGQEFDEPPTEEEDLSFICEHGHSGEIKYITDVIVDHLYQPWRTFASIINKCLCGKLTGTMRFISRHEDAQIYGAILPEEMTNQAMLDSVAYNTYYVITSRAKPPKSKKPKMKSESTISSKETPSKKKPTKTKKDVPSKKNPASKPKPAKKKAPVKADRGKGLNVLSEVALSEAAQLKEATKRSKKYFHISQASGSGDGTNFESGVPDEQQHKTSRADEGTGTIPGVLYVPKYLSESENKSWGDSDDDESNDDNSDEVTKDDDEDDVESDANDDKEASDIEKTESDEDENLNLNQNDDEEEEKEEDDVRTPDSFEFNDDDDEEYDELYKDVNVRSKVTEHKEVGKEDAEMTNTTLESPNQSFSVSSDFVSKFLNLDNASPVIDEVASMMNVKTSHKELSTQAPPNISVHVTAIPETSTIHVRIVTLIIQPFSYILHMTTPTPIPTIEPTTSLIPDLPDFASLFGIDQRVSALEQDLSQVKQVDHSAQILIQITAIKAQAETETYIDIIKKSVKEIIKDENVSLAKSSSQPQSTYKAAASLTEYELKKILLAKLEKSKSYRAAKQHRDLYNALVKSYQLYKDLFYSYGKSYSLKRGRKDKDKDEDPPAGSDQGLKKRKTRKDVELSRGFK